jgi:hypothetical protein
MVFTNVWVQVRARRDEWASMIYFAIFVYEYDLKMSQSLN